MKRTRLEDRKLPDYTRGEEMFNMVSHIVGGGVAVAALVLCVTLAWLRHNSVGIVTGAIYGSAMILLYSMSSIYHGIRLPVAKKVLQILDHCSVYILIAGTYTPFALCSIRSVSVAGGWTLFGIVWGLTALAVTLTAIDLRKFRVFSMICYIGIGWCVIFFYRLALQALTFNGLAMLIAGGVAYTLGAVLYGIGVKKRYMHSVFHLFVIAGSVLHLVCILIYVM